MTNYELPQWAETTMNITAVCLIIIMLIGSIILCTWLIIASLESEKKKKEYIDTLNEHDKSVVMTYINQKKYPDWRKRK